MQTTIVASLLALVPTDRAPSFEVEDVEVEFSAESTHLLAFDGEVSGELAVWADSGGLIHVDANFADGLYLSAVVNSDGEMISIESDDPATVASRLTAVGDRVGDDGPLASTEVPCLGMTILAATSCLTGAIPGCMVGGLGMACYCLPLLGDHPPGCP